MLSAAFIMAKIISYSMSDLVHTTICSPLYPLHSCEVTHEHTLSFHVNINTGTNDIARTCARQLTQDEQLKRMAENILAHLTGSSNTMSHHHTNLSSPKTTFAFSATQIFKRGHVQRPDDVEVCASNPSVRVLFVVLVGLCVGLDGYPQRVSIEFYFFTSAMVSSLFFLKVA